MNRLQNAYGQHYSYDRMRQAQRELAELPGDEMERNPSIHDQLKQAEDHAKHQTTPRIKRRDDLTQ